jgi:hypothetical protein
MSEYFALKKKIQNFQNEQLLDTSEKSDFFIFFQFIHHSDQLKKVNEIFQKLLVLDKKFILFKINKKYFSQTDLTLLLAIFIFKSLNKCVVTEHTSDIRYINSDVVINEITSFFSRFLIFYYHQDIPAFLDFKKNIFKILAILVEENIIKQEIIKVENKTIKEWSLGFEEVIINADEHLRLTHIPYKIIKIGRNSYLKGQFFTKVYKIFEENIRSGYVFEFKSDEYLFAAANSKYYINNGDLSDVIQLIEEVENFNRNSIKEELKILNNSIRENFKKISEEDDMVKKKYKNFPKEIIEKELKNFKFEEHKFLEFTIKIFLDFCSQILKKHKNILIAESQYENFLDVIGEIFKDDHRI